MPQAAIRCWTEPSSSIQRWKPFCIRGFSNAATTTMPVCICRRCSVSAKRG
ncbi:DUF2769 domain-containing protein [Pantoea nemavictus]|uniref:DUF2769 domain-containing protein n=1 Tax=Pantoea nemavictus TaxID=2726955 RepID=UPI0034E2FA72